MRKNFKFSIYFIASCALSTSANAHTGHGTQSLMEGLAHPFGADHLLAMLAVGIWSVSACRSDRPGKVRPPLCWRWWSVQFWGPVA
jgi:hydrogenase/urease accessory protein HupE